MPINLARVAAALNAYPWTADAFTERLAGAPRYCAVGALLRYAGVAQEHIACMQSSAGGFWQLYGGLLASEYGLADPKLVGDIIAANDSADSQGEAVERVLRVLDGSLNLSDIDRLVTEAARRAVDRLTTRVEMPERDVTPGWRPEPDDDFGSFALPG